MDQKVRIGIIHATRVSMEPIDRAFQGHWPEVETASFLDDSLSVDRAMISGYSAALDERISALATYAIRSNCDAILYACSAFGAAIESVSERLQIPVLKPNEAMFDAALANGRNIAMLYTFEPARESMEIEFNEEAAKCNPHAQLTSIYVPDAIDHLRSGNPLAHNKLIADAAMDLTDFDAIILAHFSMSRAANDVRTTTKIEILTSPDAAVVKLKNLMNQNRG